MKTSDLIDTQNLFSLSEALAPVKKRPLTPFGQQNQEPAPTDTVAQAPAPQAEPVAPVARGGKVAGEYSNTPSAVRRREQRAAKASAPGRQAMDNMVNQLTNPAPAQPQEPVATTQPATAATTAPKTGGVMQGIRGGIKGVGNWLKGRPQAKSMKTATQYSNQVANVVADQWNHAAVALDPSDTAGYQASMAAWLKSKWGANGALNADIDAAVKTVDPQSQPASVLAAIKQVVDKNRLQRGMGSYAPSNQSAPNNSQTTQQPANIPQSEPQAQPQMSVGGDKIDVNDPLGQKIMQQLQKHDSEIQDLEQEVGTLKQSTVAESHNFGSLLWRQVRESK